MATIPAIKETSRASLTRSDNPSPSVRTSTDESLDQMQTASRLLSETAHDIRSPLAGIRESIRLISDGDAGDVTGFQREILQDAISQCDNIQSLVDNMLHLDRLRSGIPAVRRQWLSPGQLKSATESVVHSLAHAKRVQVVWQGFDDGTSKVYGDLNLLRRLLVNLAGNAITVSQERARVMISLRPSINRGMVRLMIADHGVGITPEHLAQMAKRGASGTGSTGLGLAIGNSLAALHFGRLIFASQPGIGSRIGIELPSTGPAAVADAFAHWREMMAPSRGNISKHDTTQTLKEAGLRVDSAEPLKPGVYKNELQLSFEGRSPRFPYQAIINGLRLGGSVQVSDCDVVDELLQRDQRLHELVYRTDGRRWVLAWDNSEEESSRRLLELDQKIRDQVGVQLLAWQTPTTQALTHRSDRSKMRENLVRDVLHASSRLPMFDDDFARESDPEMNQQMDEAVARRLEQELTRLNSVLRRQSERLQRQAAGLDRIME